jgi:hypothetical protein
MGVSRHRQYLILQQVSLLVLPYLDARCKQKETSQSSASLHATSLATARCSAVRVVEQPPGLYQRALHCMVVPSNSRRQTVRHHPTCGFGGTHPLSLSLSCFRLVISLSPLTQEADSSPSSNLRRWQHASTVIIPPTLPPRSQTDLVVLSEPKTKADCPITSSCKSSLPSDKCLRGLKLSKVSSIDCHNDLEI